MKKVLFVCLIAASFTACNSGTAPETKVDTTAKTGKVDTTVVATPAVIDTTKKDTSSMSKMVDTTKKMSTKKDPSKKM